MAEQLLRDLAALEIAKTLVTAQLGHAEALEVMKRALGIVYPKPARELQTPRAEVKTAGTSPARSVR